MKLYSFSFPKGMIEKYQELIPPSKNKKVFRDFLFNKYSLPTSLETLQERMTNVEIYPIRMNDQEIGQIDHFISQANSTEFISRSAIVRDVYQMIIEHYKSNPLTPSETKRQTFKVPIGTKRNLSHYIEDGYRSYELSSFILESYVPSNDFPSIRGQATEGLDFISEIEVFDYLDQIAEEYSFKSGRTKLFRDAMTQFQEYIQENSPKKAMLELKLEQLLEDYSKIVTKEEILNKVYEFFNDK
ncbi:hypothetical protein [Bacillus sp. JJ722]|uniref:hypothetical protein n=1 Tax=Bacillus sp. JJ722 TaxID=3122973 RepID=UPI002FFF47ED